MKKLNIEAVKVYFAQGGEECPFCGGTNLEGSSFDVEEGTTAQDMFCVDCEKEWVDRQRSPIRGRISSRMRMSRVLCWAPWPTSGRNSAPLVIRDDLKT